MPAKDHRLLVLQSTSILEAFGGIEYYLDDLLSMAVGLYGPGSVRAIVPKRRPETEGRDVPYEITPVPFAGKPWLGKLENRYSPALFKAAREAARKLQPTLLVSGHVSLGPIVYALHLATRLPYVSIAYGLECWGSLWPQDELCFRASSAILSISHWTKHVLVDRGYREEKIAIVHPPLPAAYESLPASEGARSRMDAFTLLTVSRLDAREQYKGHDHVIEVLSRIRLTEPGLRFRYIIQGDGTDRPRLEALARGKNVGDIVEFRPPAKNREELAAVYREADLFIMPSQFGKWEGTWRGEGFGIVYVEAAAFGLPSVAYNCGGATDIIIHGDTGMLVEQDELGELARTIALLAKQPDRVRAMGKRAYERVMKSFTRAASRKQLEEALDNV